MIDIKKLREEMNKSEFSISRCSRATGIHINTLYGIAQGRTSKPHDRTIADIEKFIKEQV